MTIRIYEPQTYEEARSAHNGANRVHDVINESMLDYGEKASIAGAMRYLLSSAGVAAIEKGFVSKDEYLSTPLRDKRDSLLQYLTDVLDEQIDWSAASQSDGSPRR